jgi:hypothetical protein
VNFLTPAAFNVAQAFDIDEAGIQKKLRAGGEIIASG